MWECSKYLKCPKVVYVVLFASDRQQVMETRMTAAKIIESHSPPPYLMLLLFPCITLNHTINLG